MTNIIFRPYCKADYQACTDIFDANCPEFFALNEREEYEEFLQDIHEDYEVCEVGGRVVGAFGLLVESESRKRLNWILLDPKTHGKGIGTKIMDRVIYLGRASNTRTVVIAASQKSAPFFAKYGAMTISSNTDGWGPGMDRVDMVLPL